MSEMTIERGGDMAILLVWLGDIVTEDAVPPSTEPAIIYAVSTLLSVCFGDTDVKLFGNLYFLGK